MAILRNTNKKNSQHQEITWRDPAQSVWLSVTHSLFSGTLSEWESDTKGVINSPESPGKNYTRMRYTGVISSEATPCGKKRKVMRCP
ncbi:hypothetical protein TNCV_789091 [Trichonephila clavipes]|nr:hypothetical protein TNCV_789091 [Trichonephila clavipes]